MTDLLKSIPTYSLTERDRRWNMTRSYINKVDVDALIIWGEHEDSGPAPFFFDAWLTNDRPGCTIIFPRKGDPICLMPFFVHVLAHHDDVSKGNGGWIEPKNIRIGRSADVIAGVLHELGLGGSKAKIGVIGLEPFPVHTDGVIPYQLWANILAKFPDSIFKPVANGFTRMQMALGTEELEVVRHAAAIGDEMAKAMVAVARPGALDSEIFAAGMAAAHSRGTVVPAIMMTFPANKGPGLPAWAYRPQPPQAVKNGDVIVAEIFSNFGIRATQHQLTIAVGEVHEDIERAARITRECYDSGLQVLRPGVTFDDVCKAMLKPVEEAGGWSRGPQVHSLNPVAAVCAIPPNTGHLAGIENYPSMSAYPTMGGDLMIEAGMTFAFEPSCGFGQNMVCLGGTVIVGEDAAIELNPYTAQLHRVPGRQIQ